MCDRKCAQWRLVSRRDQWYSLSGGAWSRNLPAARLSIVVRSARELFVTHSGSVYGESVCVPVSLACNPGFLGFGFPSVSVSSSFPLSLLILWVSGIRFVLFFLGIMLIVGFP